MRFSKKSRKIEPVPNLIDYALKRATFGCLGFGTGSSMAPVVFQAFSLAKPRNLRSLDKLCLSSKTEVLGKPQY
jgi:hypothetical protein